MRSNSEAHAFMHELSSFLGVGSRSDTLRDDYEKNEVIHSPWINNPLQNRPYYSPSKLLSVATNIKKPISINHT